MAAIHQDGGRRPLIRSLDLETTTYTAHPTDSLCGLRSMRSIRRAVRNCGMPWPGTSRMARLAASMTMHAGHLEEVVGMARCTVEGHRCIKKLPGILWNLSTRLAAHCLPPAVPLGDCRWMQNHCSPLPNTAMDQILPTSTHCSH